EAPAPSLRQGGTDLRCAEAIAVGLHDSRRLRRGRAGAEHAPVGHQRRKIDVKLRCHAALGRAILRGTLLLPVRQEALASAAAAPAAELRTIAAAAEAWPVAAAAVIAVEVGEADAAGRKADLDLADRAVALLGDDHLGEVELGVHLLAPVGV